MTTVGENGYPTLQLAETDGVLTVRLNRNRARNSFNLAQIEDLTRVAQAHRTRTDLHAVVLRGADRYFSAGADLHTVQSFQPVAGETPDLSALRRIAKAGPEMCEAWEQLEPVTIAAIEGACVGAGAALVTACDFRIMGESAELRFPEVPLGISLGWRTIPRLVALIGPARTKQIVMFGQPVTARILENWGGADAVVADGEAASTALEWGARLSELPPIPVRMTKEAVNGAAYALSNTTSFMDADQFLLTAMSKDFGEGVSAFLDKRSPRFSGK